MRIQNHKKNKVQYLYGYGVPIEPTEEDKFTLACVHCGAQLSRDVEFQEYHMKKVHGLQV